MYYIYTLTCPIENVVKYVGCTKNLEARYKAHCAALAPSKNMKPWLDDLKQKNKNPIINVIFKTEDASEAVNKEIEGYEYYQKGQLLCINPNKKNYVDLGALKTLKNYYLSPVFMSIISARINKTKTFNSLKEHKKQRQSIPGAMMFVALDLDRFRVKGLEALELCQNIPADRKRIVRDLLTNNYIE